MDYYHWFDGQGHEFRNGDQALSPAKHQRYRVVAAVEKSRDKGKS